MAALPVILAGRSVFLDFFIVNIALPAMRDDLARVPPSCIRGRSSE